MGLNHLRVLLEHPHFELVSVVEPIKNRPASLPDSVPLLKNFAELKGLDFDCAVIAAPTMQHYDLTSALLKLKKPILVEKPIASSVSQANELLKLIAIHETPLFVGHLERFNPAILKLREILKSGILGEAIHFSFTRIGGYPENVEKGNNVILDLAVHDLDIFRFLEGPPKVVASLCHRTFRKDTFDTAEILLQGPANASASVHVNWVSPTKIRGIRVTGTKGVCMVDYILQTCTLFGGSFLERSPEPELDFEQVIEHYRNSDRVEFGIKKEEPLKAQLEQFYLALQGKPNFLCTAEEAAQAVALAEQAISQSQLHTQSKIEGPHS